MTFDPDAYLASKPSGSFDPDAYLAGSKPAEPAVDPREARIEAIKKVIEAQQSGRPQAYPFAKSVADNLVLGVARPISSAIGATAEGITGEHPGSSWGERYAAHVRNQNARATGAEQELSPLARGTAATASLPASYMTGGGGTAMSVGRSALAAMVPGFVEGAAKNAETLQSAAAGGTKDALISGAATLGLGAAARSLNPAEWRAAAAEAAAARGATPDQIKTQARTLYRQLDDAGIAYDPHQTTALYTALHDMRNSARYSPNANPALSDYFDQLQALSRNGANYTQLQDLRSAIAEQTRNADPSTRRAAGEILGHIDQTIRQVPAVNPTGIDIASAHPEASRLWRAASLADDAGWTAGKTERKTAVKSGVDPDATTRANFARVEERVSRPGAYDPYSDQQRELLSRIVRGDRVQNMQAATGDFLQRNANKIGIGAGAATSAAGLAKGFEVAPSVLAATVGLPVTGVSNLAGSALKGAAAGRGQANVNALLRDITGSPLPVPGAAIDRGDLAQIIFARDLARLSGQQGSSGE